MNRKNVTFIDDLFDADTMNMQQSQPPTDYMIKGNIERDDFTNQINNRHIRSNNRNYSYALNGGNEQSQSTQLVENYQRPFLPFELDNFQQPRYNFQNNQSYEPYERMIEHHAPHHGHRNNESSIERFHEDISCMTVANHIKDCPICSKFYNNDNSMYIVCIALLIIVCIILLKRIIENK